MKIKEIKKLKIGDEVRWTDPDNNLCSKTLKIVGIRINGHIICITDMLGNYLECFAKELS